MIKISYTFSEKYSKMKMSKAITSKDITFEENMPGVGQQVFTWGLEYSGHKPGCGLEVNRKWIQQLCSIKTFHQIKNEER